MDLDEQAAVLALLGVRVTVQVMHGHGPQPVPGKQSPPVCSLP